MNSNRLALPLALLAFTATAIAQTATHRPPTASHKTATAKPVASAPAAPACAKLPDLSPKIPALPPGLHCARPLYTISTIPPARLEYVAPMVNSEQIAKTLGIEGNSFSLDYVDSHVGTGELAAPHKWYTINYTGYLIDGTKFDSSVDRNEPINVHYGAHQVIPGWDTGFEGMHVGGKRRLFIPYQLAYGAQGKGPIPPNSELIFDVELISQSDTEPAKPTPPASSSPSKPSDEPAGNPAAKPATPPPAADPTKPETTTKPQGL